MAYVPAELDNIRPGISATTWGTAATNHDQLYESAYCHVFSSMNFGIETQSRDSTWANNPVVLAIRNRGNVDDQTVRFMVRMKTSNASYAAQLQATLDSTDTTVASTTSTSFAWVTFDITPTTSSADGDIYLRLRAAPNSEVSPPYAYLDSVLCYIKPSAPGAGTQTSGFIALDPTNVANTNYPISTEFVQRVTDGPRRIAVDRPVCIVSLARDVTAARDVTTSTTNVVAYCGRMYLPDRMARNYYVSVYQGPAPGVSDTAISEIIVAGKSTGDISGNGFQGATISLDGYQQDNSGLQPRLVEFTAFFRSTGGGAVALKTLQIFRSS